jgi:hypothetical protein
MGVNTKPAAVSERFALWRSVDKMCGPKPTGRVILLPARGPANQKGVEISEALWHQLRKLASRHGHGLEDDRRVLLAEEGNRFAQALREGCKAIRCPEDVRDSVQEVLSVLALNCGLMIDRV